MFQKKAKNPDKLAWWVAPAWSSRAVSVAINAVLIMQITYYCTDMVGMSAGLVGMVLLASKLFDGVTDLIVGFIIDKTKTRFGKARPYEIFTVLLWICTVLMYSVPNASTTVQAIYVFVMYSLVSSVCITFLGGSDATYMSRAIPNPENQVKVLSTSGMLVMLFSMIVSIIFPQLLAGIGSTKAGWPLMMICFAIPLSIIGMLRFIFIKEVDDEKTNEVQPESSENLSIKESVGVLAKNKYIFIISAIMFLNSVSGTLGTSSGIYYFKYIVGNVGLMSLVSMISLVTPLLLIIYPILARKFGNTNMLRAGAILTAVGVLIRTLGGSFLPTIILGSFLSNFGIMPISIMINVYLIECMDYGEWKTGTRIEGMMSSLSNFASKVGGGVASALVGFIMGVAGYDGTLAIQSATANTAIVSVYNYVPLILSVLILILTFIYDLTKKIPMIQQEIAVRKQK